MTRAIEITESLAARFPNDANYRQNLWRIYQIASGIYEEIDYARMYELATRRGKLWKKQSRSTAPMRRRVIIWR